MRALQLLVLMLGLTTIGHPALACSQRPDFTFEQAFNDGSLVFRALVTDVQLNPYVDPSTPSGEEPMGHGDAKGRNLMDIRYELLETFKGNPQPVGVVTTNTAIMGGCGLPAIPGWQFLFVVTPFDKDKPEDFQTDSQGLVWVFSSTMLPSSKPQLDTALAEVRKLSAK